MRLVPLIADIGDVVGMLITIAIIGFTVISQILGALGNGQRKKPGQPRRPAQGRPRPGPQPAPPKPPGRIENEIDDFLRQARGQKQRPKPPQPRPVQVKRPVIDAVPADDEVIPGQGFAEDLATHVQEHIGRDAISPRTDSLGEVVGHSDEKIEHHLEEVFDHDVGRLAHEEIVDSKVAEGTDAAIWDQDAEEAPATTPSQTIAEMLKTPQSIRNVFVLSEILKRPEI